MVSGISTICYNTDGCAEYYIFAILLYVFSILLQTLKIIVDHEISVPGHGREVVYNLNATEKRFIFNMMITVQLPDCEQFDTQMAVHTSAQNSDVSLAQ